MKIFHESFKTKYTADGEEMGKAGTLPEGYWDTYRDVMDAKAQEKMITRLVDKIRKNRDKIIRTQNLYLDDAEVVVVSYGISARSAMQAVRDARNEGIKAGLIKLDTVWPFPEELIRSVAPRTRAMIMAEINGGQMALELERSAGGACPVSLVSNYGGKILHPGLILNAVAKAATEKP